MKKFFCLIIFIVCVSSVSCGPSTKSLSVKEYKEYLNAMVDVAKKTGSSLVLTADVTGNPNVYAKQEFGLDLGIKAHGTFQVNAK